MMRCEHCGEVFEDSNVDIYEWDEPRGEYFGMPCSEHMSELRCPYCDSNDIEEDYVEEDEA